MITDWGGDAERAPSPRAEAGETRIAASYENAVPSTLRMETDLARWSDAHNLPDSWSHRSEFAARFVPEGATLMDIGCGKMAIEEMLPPGCTYIPVDLVRRDERT